MSDGGNARRFGAIYALSLMSIAAGAGMVGTVLSLWYFPFDTAVQYSLVHYLYGWPLSHAETVLIGGVILTSAGFVAFRMVSRAGPPSNATVSDLFPELVTRDD